MPNSYSYQQIHDRKLAESICVSATVRVLKFDPEKMTVNVQPMSKHLQNGKFESQPPILGVPVALTHSGGFIFRPWIKPGDTGTVVYLDHDMDSTVTKGGEAEPLTERNHQASDAIFVGAIVSGSYTSKNLPDEALVMATEDGKIYVAVEKDKVTIKVKDHTLAEFKEDSIDKKSIDMNIALEGKWVVTTGDKIYLN